MGINLVNWTRAIAEAAARKGLLLRARRQREKRITHLPTYLCSAISVRTSTRARRRLIDPLLCIKVHQAVLSRKGLNGVRPGGGTRCLFLLLCLFGSRKDCALNSAGAWWGVVASALCKQWLSLVQVQGCRGGIERVRERKNERSVRFVWIVSSLLRVVFVKLLGF